jgi:hypothetical protein
VPLTNRVMVTIVLTPSFFVCFVYFVVVICRFKDESKSTEGKEELYLLLSSFTLLPFVKALNLG